MTRKWFTILAILVSVMVVALLLLISSACLLTRGIERADVVGRYVSNYEQANYRYSYKHHPELQDGIHHLELDPNGKYTYEYESFDAKRSGKNSNEWRFERAAGNGPRIILADFAFDPEEYQVEVNSSTSLSVTSGLRLDGLRIIINDDLGYYFRKEK